MTLFALSAFFCSSVTDKKFPIVWGGCLALYSVFLGFIASDVLCSVIAAAVCLFGILFSRTWMIRLGRDAGSVAYKAQHYLTLAHSKLCQKNFKLNYPFFLGVVTCIAIGLHLLPGGASWGLQPPVRLGFAQVDWLWKVKLFNALIGLGLICKFYRPNGVRFGGILIALIVVLSVLSIALIVGHWHSSWQWDPKYPAVWPWFCILMLSFTVIPEEAFFRYCIQEPIHNRFGVMSLVFTPIIFGAVHGGSGLAFASIATLAGLGYAVIWHYYRELTLCCICHWLVNILHFTFLTYPY
jgi:uncharacterized protein